MKLFLPNSKEYQDILSTRHEPPQISSNSTINSEQILRLQKSPIYLKTYAFAITNSSILPYTIKRILKDS